jgi:two-component system C4-dicarboxylate transport response regulator DctD
MTPFSVLLADDEAEIRNLIRGWLERSGHHVTMAANGVEAAAILQAKVFDVVVTDMLMPESDGVQLIALVKKSSSLTRILAISGGGRVLDGTDCIRMAQGLGAHGAVMKPFTRDQFMTAFGLATNRQPASTTSKP